MIDLTPLDVRNKRGDFKKAMRGYEPHEVDLFLEMVADRLETLVRENLQLRERTETLQTQVTAQNDREQAVQDALVTAQALRADIRAQSQREADHVIREAEVEARRMVAEADEVVRERLRGIERQLDQATRSVDELERRRARFLTEFRGLLERELDVVHVEESRVPLEARAIDLELGPSAHPEEAARRQDSAASSTAERAGDTVPLETPTAESVSEESADTIIPAGVDPFFSSDLHVPPEDLVPPGGVSGSIAAGGLAAKLGFDAPSEVDPPTLDDLPGGGASPGEHYASGDAPSEAATSYAPPATEGFQAGDSETGVGAPPEGPASAPPEPPAIESPAGAGAGAGTDTGVSTSPDPAGSSAMDVDALRPDLRTSMPDPEVFTSEAEAYHEQRYGPRPDPTVIPVDVADLGPSGRASHEGEAAASSQPPSPEVGELGRAGDAPSSLEMELMAGASSEGTRPIEDRDRFAGIPDLETVLAEAGVDDTAPLPEEVPPPPVDTDDPILLFDPDDDDPYRR